MDKQTVLNICLVVVCVFNPFLILFVILFRVLFHPPDHKQKDDP